MNCDDRYDASMIPELIVLHFETSLDFYIKVAGFHIVYDRPEENFAMLEINGARLMIEEFNPNGRFWLVGEMERPFGRGMHLQIEVEDVDRHYHNFTKIHYPILFAMEEKWYRIGQDEKGHKQFLVQDPDGYLLRFFENIGIRPV